MCVCAHAHARVTTDNFEIEERGVAEGMCCLSGFKKGTSWPRQMAVVEMFGRDTHLLSRKPLKRAGAIELQGMI